MVRNYRHEMELDWSLPVNCGSCGHKYAIVRKDVSCRGNAGVREVYSTNCPHCGCEIVLLARSLPRLLRCGLRVNCYAAIDVSRREATRLQREELARQKEAVAREREEERKNRALVKKKLVEENKAEKRKREMARLNARIEQRRAKRLARQAGNPAVGNQEGNKK